MHKMHRCILNMIFSDGQFCTDVQFHLVLSTELYRPVFCRTVHNMYYTVYCACMYVCMHSIQYKPFEHTIQADTVFFSVYLNHVFVVIVFIYSFLSSGTLLLSQGQN